MVPGSMREAMEKRRGPVDDYVWTRLTVEKPLLPMSATVSAKEDITDMHRIRLKNITGIEFQRNPVSECLKDV
jgi:hypothetical protein